MWSSILQKDTNSLNSHRELGFSVSLLSEDMHPLIDRYNNCSSFANKPIPNGVTSLRSKIKVSFISLSMMIGAECAVDNSSICEDPYFYSLCSWGRFFGFLLVIFLAASRLSRLKSSCLKLTEFLLLAIFLKLYMLSWMWYVLPASRKIGSCWSWRILDGLQMKIFIRPGYRFPYRQTTNWWLGGITKSKNTYAHHFAYFYDEFVCCHAW